MRKRFRRLAVLLPLAAALSAMSCQGDIGDNILSVLDGLGGTGVNVFAGNGAANARAEATGETVVSLVDSLDALEKNDGYDAAKGNLRDAIDKISRDEEDYDYSISDMKDLIFGLLDCIVPSEDALEGSLGNVLKASSNEESRKQVAAILSQTPVDENSPAYEAYGLLMEGVRVLVNSVNEQSGNEQDGYRLSSGSVEIDLTDVLETIDEPCASDIMVMAMVADSMDQLSKMVETDENGQIKVDLNKGSVVDLVESIADAYLVIDVLSSANEEPKGMVGLMKTLIDGVLQSSGLEI